MMRTARVYVNGDFAGNLVEIEKRNRYEFRYADDYSGAPVSLTMPVETRVHIFEKFPPFFEGVLPEGMQLDALLREKKIDRDDYFSQLVAVGGDLVGAVTVEEET